jgi:hypothetical protein
MATTRSLLLIAIVGAVLLSGCTGDGGIFESKSGQQAKRVSGVGGFVGEAYAAAVDAQRSAKPDYDFTKVIEGDHGAPGLHALRELHSHKFGLEQVGYSPLVDTRDPTAWDSGFTALDTWDDGTNFYVCVTHFAGNGGADIADITDPANIKMLAHIDSGMVNSDCQFTDDGKYLFLGAYTGVDAMNDAMAQYRESFRETIPVAGVYDLLGNGVSVWNVEDKADPKFVLFSDTGTYHNLFTVTINDVYWLIQTYPSSVPGPHNIYRFNPEGQGAIIGVFETEYMQHDMTVARHPITGDWLLYTGKGQGLGIMNFNDPTAPFEIGEWVPPTGPNTVKGWHEQEVIPHLVDGRALVIVGGEVNGAGSQPYGVIDVSDPTDPVLLSTWDLPGKPSNSYPDNFYTYSPHEIGTWNGYVVIANYHAGVWLWDVGNIERMQEPVTLGHFYANEDPVMHGAPQNPPFAFNPDHWGAYFDSRGHIVTADWGSGLYVLKFDKTGTWTPPENGRQP